MGEGDRVALLVPPGIDLTVCLYACWRMGAVVVLVDAGLGARGIGRALKSATPRYLIGIPRALRPRGASVGPGGASRPSPMAPTARDALGVVDHPRCAPRARRRADPRRRHRPIPISPRWCSPRARPVRPRACRIAIISSRPSATCSRACVRHHRRRPVRRRVRAVRPLRPGDGGAVGRTRHGRDRARHAACRRAGRRRRSIDATLVFASPAALANVIATAGDLTPRHRERPRPRAAAPVGRRAGAELGAARRGRGHAERRGPHALRHDRGAARHRHHAGRDRGRGRGERRVRRPSDRRGLGRDQPARRRRSARPAS